MNRFRINLPSSQWNGPSPLTLTQLQTTKTGAHFTILATIQTRIRNRKRFFKRICNLVSQNVAFSSHYDHNLPQICSEKFANSFFHSSYDIQTPTLFFFTSAKVCVWYYLTFVFEHFNLLKGKDKTITACLGFYTRSHPAHIMKFDKQKS